MFLSPTFLRFIRYAKPYWGIVALAMFCGIMKFTLALALPGSLGLVMDYVLLTDLPRDVKLTRMLLILGMLSLAFLGRMPATYFRSYFAVIAGNRTIFNIRRDLFHHIQRLSMAFHGNRRTGSTISRLINDLNTAQGILNQGVIAVGMDIIFLIGVVVFLVIWDFRLAAVSLATLPVYAVVFRIINPRLRAVSSQVQEEMEELSGEVTEKVGALQVVMSFTREKTEELNFFKCHRRYYKKVVSRERLRLFLSTTAEFLSAVGPIVVISYGGYRVISGSLSPGELLIFNGFLAHLYLPTRRLADYSSQLQEKLAAMDRVFELFDCVPDIEDAPDAVPIARMEGRIVFRDVHFSYLADQPVLTGINLNIEPGEAVAFVGRSGAGKSTLVNLIPRFYDATRGAILIDGQDTRGMTIKSLRDHIGIVLQESILFSGTIRDNILYGRRSATEAEMREAAEMAHVTDFVNELPKRFDTRVGERGVSLSGGQKQRLSIARAFLRNPRILILDEATSSLDSGAEQIIQDALRHLMKGRTTLVIAHRLSTIVDCDRVVVLEHGSIVQEGPHSELIKTRGPYRKLCKEQFGSVSAHELNQKAG